MLAMLDILQGRLAFPVYGIRVDTPAIAAFAVAVFYAASLSMCHGPNVLGGDLHYT